MSTTRAWLAAALSAGTTLAPLACSVESRGYDAFAEPPALARVAASPRQTPLEYSFAAENHAEFMVARREGAGQLLGDVPLAAGRLWLDPSDLSASRASLTFDLSGVQLWDEGTPKPPKGASRSTSTEQSLDWLQLARAADIQARPELRYARFTLLGIGSSSSNDLDAAPMVRSGQPAGVARRVRLRANGELELHGHRLPQTVAITATFDWLAADEPGTPPRRVLLETTEPISVDLLGFDVVPRNGRGELLTLELADLRRTGRGAIRVRARWVAELVRQTGAGSLPASNDP